MPLKTGERIKEYQDTRMYRTCPLIINEKTDSNKMVSKEKVCSLCRYRVKDGTYEGDCSLHFKEFADALKFTRKHERFIRFKFKKEGRVYLIADGDKQRLCIGDPEILNASENLLNFAQADMLGDFIEAWHDNCLPYHLLNPYKEQDNRKVEVTIRAEIHLLPDEKGGKDLVKAVDNLVSGSKVSELTYAPDVNKSFVELAYEKVVKPKFDFSVSGSKVRKFVITEEDFYKMPFGVVKEFLSIVDNMDIIVKNKELGIKYIEFTQPLEDMFPIACEYELV